MLQYLLLLLTFFIAQSQAANPILFCKCFCGSNSTIFELPMMDPKPCANCTKQFCLDNVEDGMCDGIADETCPSNDFRTNCFGMERVKKKKISIDVFINKRKILNILFAIVIFIY